ncbi:MAG: glycosyltransferase [Pseudomonadota bacterium]
MSHPRVALLLPSTSLGGAERMIIRIANDLGAHGVDTHVLLLADTGVLTDAIDDTVTLHRLDAARARQAPTKLVKTLRALRPDTVFSSHARLNLMQLGLRALLAGRPRAVIREASNPIADMEIQNTGRVYRPLYKALYPRADALICQSLQMVDDFDRLMGRRLDNLVQIYNPARQDLIEARKADIASPFTQAAAHQLLTCGSLTHRKGYDVLLNALKPVVDGGLDLRLTLLGDGPERPALEAQAASLGLSDRVHFNGRTLDNAPFYLHADLFLQPSRIEGLPNTVIESMACGTPVVASDCPGGTRELVRNGENGLLFDTEDVAGLSAALTTVLPSLDRYPADAVRASIAHLHPETVFATFRDTLLG